MAGATSSRRSSAGTGLGTVLSMCAPALSFEMSVLPASIYSTSKTFAWVKMVVPPSSHARTSFGVE